MGKKKKKVKATFLKLFKLYHTNHLIKPLDEAKAWQGDTLLHLVDLVHFSVSITQSYSNQESPQVGKQKPMLPVSHLLPVPQKHLVSFVLCDIPILPLRMY